MEEWLPLGSKATQARNLASRSCVCLCGHVNACVSLCVCMFRWNYTAMVAFLNSTTHLCPLQARRRHFTSCTYKYSRRHRASTTLAKQYSGSAAVASSRQVTATLRVNTTLSAELKDLPKETYNEFTSVLALPHPHSDTEDTNRIPIPHRPHTERTPHQSQPPTKAL